MKLYLYLVERSETSPLAVFGEYGGFVCCATSAAEARNTKIGDIEDEWVSDTSTLRVTMLGEAAPSIEPGIVLASYYGD